MENGKAATAEDARESGLSGREAGRQAGILRHRRQISINTWNKNTKKTSN